MAVSDSSIGRIKLYVKSFDHGSLGQRAGGCTPGGYSYKRLMQASYSLMVLLRA